jgi:vacuolar-type H+-ATPase subunit I/STV1
MFKDCGFLLIHTKYLPVLHVPVFKSCGCSSAAYSVILSLILQKLSDISTQTNEMPHIEEEVVILKSKVKELVQQLEDGNSQKETLKKTLESKLEQQDKKIKVVYKSVVSL